MVSLTVFSTLSFLIAEIKLSYCRRYCGVFSRKEYTSFTRKRDFCFYGQKEGKSQNHEQKGREFGKC